MHGNSREARQLRERLAQAGALAADSAAGLHVIVPHPFAEDVAALQARFTPCIMLRRPGWAAAQGDNWHWVASPQQAADWLAEHAAGPVLVALGNERLAPFYALTSTPLVIRSRKAPHPAHPPLGEVIVDSGPFSEASEIAAFRKHGITTVVAHDAGGQGGWPKLAAARALGLPVVLLRRPDWPAGTAFDDVATLWRHLRGTLGLDLPPYAP